MGTLPGALCLPCFCVPVYVSCALSHTLSNTIAHGVCKLAEKPALSFRLDKELKDRLTALARADRRPLAQYVTLALAEHVEAKEAEAAKSGARKKPGVK